MTLNEAMVKVLCENGEPMTTREIAEAINANGLYSRADGKPVQASQISARLNHYLEVFAREGKKVRLRK